LHWRERPNNVLTCTFASHKKPSNQFVISTVEQWIPGLSVAGLGVRTLVNPRPRSDKLVLEAKRRPTEDRTSRQETGGNGKSVLLERIRGLEAVVQQLKERCPTAGASVPAVEIDLFPPLVIQSGKERCPTAGASVPAVEIDPFPLLVIQSGGKRCPTAGASVPAVEIDLPSCHHPEACNNSGTQQSVSQPEEQSVFTQQSASQPEKQRFFIQQSASQPEEPRFFIQQSASQPEKQRFFTQQSASQPDEPRILVQQSASQPGEQRIFEQQSASQPEKEMIFVQQRETTTNLQEATVLVADTGGAVQANLLDEEVTTESTMGWGVLVRHSLAESKSSIGQLCYLQSASRRELLALQPDVL
jgi:hypothetical protein